MMYKHETSIPLSHRSSRGARTPGPPLVPNYTCAQLIVTYILEDNSARLFTELPAQQCLDLGPPGTSFSSDTLIGEGRRSLYIDHYSASYWSSHNIGHGPLKMKWWISDAGGNRK